MPDYEHLKKKQFQFHKGTIKAQRPLSPAEQYMNFNSIKVQLKRNVERLRRCYIPLFQFHKGTIKARNDPKLQDVLIEYFNSIKVQLKPLQNAQAHIDRLYFNSIKVQLKPRIARNHTIGIPISIP